MTDPRKDNNEIDRYILKDAVNEAKAMGREGMQHPSTMPVLAGAGVGALAGGLLLGAWPIGLIAGAGFMLYRRVRP